MKYSADFETTTDLNDCRVWATGICSIDEKLDFFYGNSIDFLFDFARNSDGDTFYFHNLKFDGEFILCELFERGFKLVKDKKNLNINTFATLISDMGLFYGIWIMFDNGAKVEILDSLKIIPFSVDVVAKTFNLPIMKLEIDYKEKRKVGHELTKQEIAYLRNDVEIIARALSTLFGEGLDRMTQGSNALFDYKHTVGVNKFKRWFPGTQV